MASVLRVEDLTSRHICANIVRVVHACEKYSYILPWLEEKTKNGPASTCNNMYVKTNEGQNKNTKIPETFLVLARCGGHGCDTKC